MTATLAERPGLITATAVGRLVALAAALLLCACGTLPREAYDPAGPRPATPGALLDRKSTRLNSRH